MLSLDSSHVLCQWNCALAVASFSLTLTKQAAYFHEQHQGRWPFVPKHKLTHGRTHKQMWTTAWESPWQCLTSQILRSESLLLKSQSLLGDGRKKLFFKGAFCKLGANVHQHLVALWLRKNYFLRKKNGHKLRSQRKTGWSALSRSWENIWEHFIIWPSLHAKQRFNTDG